MGDPETEGRFERARELHRRTMQRSFERRPESGETIIARATIQKLPEVADAGSADAAETAPEPH
jgi:hypothetical protein